MWFKQVQLLHLTSPFKFSSEKLSEQLEPFAFTPCLPSMPSSMGFISPIDEEDAPLTRSINGCVMFCLQVEEKILPASVITQALKERIKHVESFEARKVRKQEKLTFKDEVTHTLLMRAFTKLSCIYAYVDTRNNWLIINTTSPKKTELFVTMFKKAFGEIVETYDVTKPSSIITNWLKSKDYPTQFAVEKACVLQDPNHQHRVIRCQQQDLFSTSIQDLLKDGCEAIQTAFCWHDKLNFVLADDFTIRSITLSADDLAEINDIAESKSQKFDADLIMMSELFVGLINDLLSVFVKTSMTESKLAIAV